MDEAAWSSGGNHWAMEDPVESAGRRPDGRARCFASLATVQQGREEGGRHQSRGTGWKISAGSADLLGRIHRRGRGLRADRVGETAGALLGAGEASERSCRVGAAREEPTAENQSHGMRGRHCCFRTWRCRSTLLTAAVAAACVHVACGLTIATHPLLRANHGRPGALVTCKMSTKSVGSFVDESPVGKTAFAIAWEKAQQRAHSKHQEQNLFGPSSPADEIPASSVAVVSQEVFPDAEGFEGSDSANRLVGVWAAWLNENCPADLTSALAGLTDERASQRKAAVTRLLNGLPSGQTVSGPAEKHWAWAAFAARLGDNSAAVREAAVKGLAAISEKGNRNAVLAMANLIEEEKAITVRTAALQALSRVAQRGDEEALAPVLNLLRRVEGVERGDVFTPNLSSRIKRQAIKALSTLADPGNECAIKALVKRIMDDKKPEVREAAIRGLPGIACPSDPQIIWVLSMSCQDEDESVRRTARRNLRLLLKRQEAKQVLKRAAAAAGSRAQVSVARGFDCDGDDTDSHARIYWLLPGVWDA